MVHSWFGTPLKKQVIEFKQLFFKKTDEKQQKFNKTINF